MIVRRRSPVQASLSQPAYIFIPSPSKTQSQSQAQLQRPLHFKTQTPGFGSRHVNDNAPFSLWDCESATFRESRPRELEWMFTIYNARWIDVDLPDIIIRTDRHPTEIPVTVGGALVRFIPEDMFLPNIPAGSLRPYPSTQRDDLLSSSLPLHSIPSHQQCHEIIRLLELEVGIRAIYFLPPQIIAELDMAGGKN